MPTAIFSAFRQTGLRYFTVYGPWGRPDQALFTFTRKILAASRSDVYNNGEHRRDFTYVDDAWKLRFERSTGWRCPMAVGMAPPRTRLLRRRPTGFNNIGGNNRSSCCDTSNSSKRFLGRTATKRLLPMQPGDVPETWADTSDLVRELGFEPQTPLGNRCGAVHRLYRDYYEVGELPIGNGLSG